MRKRDTATRALVLVLGDQLDPASPLLETLDPERDRVAMAEVEDEIRRYPNHKQRVALFLSAMRHFRDDLRRQGISVRYQSIEDPDTASSIPEFLRTLLGTAVPERVRLLRPGRLDLEEEIRAVAAEADCPVEFVDDPHFLCSSEEFADWAGGRKRMVMEHFYRAQRKRLGVLMDGEEPAGGAWNFDSDNRESFDSAPDDLVPPAEFPPDRVTTAVLELVEERFSDLPGELDSFNWPVTPEDAWSSVLDFIEHRLHRFGQFQDAMWVDEPTLYHSRISAALNLKLVDPRRVVNEVEQAYRDGRVPINSAEGFIRQVIGWREFIRGVYWLEMPALAEANELDAAQPLPELYWSADTSMTCMGQAVGQVLEHGYAHHIQRLMVTGLFALLYGARPKEVHEWFMATHVDSVEWVTLPNVVGMSQYADGGIVGTKPYVASGKYIQRQSNYCDECRFDPAQAYGDDACPFTTLYWEFLDRHEEDLADNRRMNFQLANLRRKSDQDRIAIRERAEWVRTRAQAKEL
ncbi:MAG: cryptochrome/photolyase family protein [Gemmatimonadetes bacterium]|nr:cryptochrome/photolyase family protein [Gemmatimonadota bacterium]